MKKIIILTILICFTTVAYTQNLVPNPDFDNDEYCPWNQCQIDFATGWSSYGRSPDYFHSCAIEGAWSVPVNATGFQYPASGDAYAGLGAFGYSYTPNIREYIGIELNEPLEIGIDYFVSFKAALTHISRFATKNLGVLFSTVSYSIKPEGLYCHHDSVPLPPLNYAHVYSEEFISDTANWTTISGWFTADSAYKYLIIGNFFDDDNTEYAIFNPSSSSTATYYLIDDVYVGRYPPQINKPKQKSNFKIDIYPNPIDDQTNIIIDYSVGINNINMKLFDIHGREVTNKVDIIKVNKQQYEIIRNNLSKGMYFLQTQINSEILNSKLLFN